MNLSRIFIAFLAMVLACAFASTASADPIEDHRVDHDACGDLAQKHVRPTQREDEYIMCGERIELPPHRTYQFKDDLQPPTCQHGLWMDGTTRADVAFQILVALIPNNTWKWHYFVQGGDTGVRWNFFIAPTVRHDRVVSVVPEIHNFTPHTRQVRVYFRCNQYQPPPKPS